MYARHEAVFAICRIGLCWSANPKVHARCYPRQRLLQPMPLISHLGPRSPLAFLAVPRMRQTQKLRRFLYRREAEAEFTRDWPCTAFSASSR